MPVVRGRHEAKRQDELRGAKVEVQGLRGVLHASHRLLGEGALGLPRVALLQGQAGRHARPGKDLQEEGREVLGDLALARGGRGGPSRRLRRRDIPRPGPRRLDRLHGRARGGLAHGQKRELEVV